MPNARLVMMCPQCANIYAHKDRVVPDDAFCEIARSMGSGWRATATTERLQRFLDAHLSCDPNAFGIPGVGAEPYFSLIID